MNTVHAEISHLLPCTAANMVAGRGGNVDDRCIGVGNQVDPPLHKKKEHQCQVYYDY